MVCPDPAFLVGIPLWLVFIIFSFDWAGRISLVLSECPRGCFLTKWGSSGPAVAPPALFS